MHPSFEVTTRWLRAGQIAPINRQFLICFSPVLLPFAWNLVQCTKAGKYERTRLCLSLTLFVRFLHKPDILSCRPTWPVLKMPRNGADNLNHNRNFSPFQKSWRLVRKTSEYQRELERGQCFDRWKSRVPVIIPVVKSIAEFGSRILPGHQFLMLDVLFSAVEY